MSYIAVVLIITSALMHALWNFVSKRQNPSLAFFFFTTVSAAIFVSPLIIIHRHSLPLIPISVWGLVIATGIAQMVYFFGLAGAYRHGDMSLAYPLARSLPILLVAAISLFLGNGSDIGRMSLAGMALIIVGCIILPLPQFHRMQPRNYFNLVFLMAAIAAIGTAGYTLIDDQALRQLRDTSAIQLSSGEITLLFVSLQTISTCLMLGIVTMLYRPERLLLMRVIRNRSQVISGMVTGVVIMATYGLVLASMAYVSNVSYVAAFRQLSIPIGAVLGLTFLREPRHIPKLVGLGIVSFGLILVGIG